MSRPYAWTYADYARLPNDGRRYEILDGRLLVTPTPSPRHQRIAFLLGIRLEQYIERLGLGMMLPDVDLLFASGQFLRPDLMFVPIDARDGITNRGMERTPGLIIEILSPDSAAMDRVEKPRRYAEFSVPEYWVVDPEEEVVWVWRFASGQRDAERVAGRITWLPPGSYEPLTIELKEIFSSQMGS